MRQRIFIGDSDRGLKPGTDDEWHQLEVHEHKGLTMFGNWNAHEFFNKFQRIEGMGSIHNHPHLLKGKTNEIVVIGEVDEEDETHNCEHMG